MLNDIEPLDSRYLKEKICKVQIWMISFFVYLSQNEDFFLPFDTTFFVVLNVLSSDSQNAFANNYQLIFLFFLSKIFTLEIEAMLFVFRQ